MNFIRPNWAAPQNVKAVSTTRVGGISIGNYEGLNLGMHVADAAEKVMLNRAALHKELKLKNEPFWLNQVHSTAVLDADGSLPLTAGGSLPPTADGSLLPTADGSLPPTADGSYTSKVNTVCVVMTADCLPLLMTNKAGTQVAAVHLGWRGLADGIVENAIKAFKCPPSEILAWAGPCIGASAFEVGAEVRDQLGGPSSAYKVSSNNNKYLADLVAITGDKLLNFGVDDFSASKQCTYTDAQQFYSYRRDGQCGRMASLIWMDS